MADGFFKKLGKKLKINSKRKVSSWSLKGEAKEIGNSFGEGFKWIKRTVGIKLKDDGWTSELAGFYGSIRKPPKGFATWGGKILQFKLHFPNWRYAWFKRWGNAYTSLNYNLRQQYHIAEMTDEHKISFVSANKILDRLGSTISKEYNTNLKISNNNKNINQLRLDLIDAETMVDNLFAELSIKSPNDKNRIDKLNRDIRTTTESIYNIDSRLSKCESESERSLLMANRSVYDSRLNQMNQEVQNLSNGIESDPRKTKKLMDSIARVNSIKKQINTLQNENEILQYTESKQIEMEFRRTSLNYNREQLRILDTLSNRLDYNNALTSAVFMHVGKMSAELSGLAKTEIEHIVKFNKIFSGVKSLKEELGKSGSPIINNYRSDDDEEDEVERRKRLSAENLNKHGAALDTGDVTPQIYELQRATKVAQMKQFNINFDWLSTINSNLFIIHNSIKYNTRLTLENLMYLRWIRDTEAARAYAESMSDNEHMEEVGKYVQNSITKNPWGAIVRNGKTFPGIDTTRLFDLHIHKNPFDFKSPSYRALVTPPIPSGVGAGKRHVFARLGLGIWRKIKSILGVLGKVFLGPILWVAGPIVRFVLNNPILSIVCCAIGYLLYKITKNFTDAFYGSEPDTKGKDGKKDTGWWKDLKQRLSKYFQGDKKDILGAIAELFKFIGEKIGEVISVITIAYDWVREKIDGIIKDFTDEKELAKYGLTPDSPFWDKLTTIIGSKLSNIWDSAKDKLNEFVVDPIMMLISELADAIGLGARAINEEGGFVHKYFKERLESGGKSNFTDVFSTKYMTDEDRVKYSTQKEMNQKIDERYNRGEITQEQATMMKSVNNADTKFSQNELDYLHSAADDFGSDAGFEGWFGSNFDIDEIKKAQGDYSISKFKQILYNSLTWIINYCIKHKERTIRLIQIMTRFLYALLDRLITAYIKMESINKKSDLSMLFSDGSESEYNRNTGRFVKESLKELSEYINKYPKYKYLLDFDSEYAFTPATPFTFKYSLRQYYDYCNELDQYNLSDEEKKVLSNLAYMKMMVYTRHHFIIPVSLKISRYKLHRGALSIPFEVDNSRNSRYTQYLNKHRTTELDRNICNLIAMDNRPFETIIDDIDSKNEIPASEISKYSFEKLKEENLKKRIVYISYKESVFYISTKMETIFNHPERFFKYDKGRLITYDKVRENSEQSSFTGWKWVALGVAIAAVVAISILSAGLAAAPAAGGLMAGLGSLGWGGAAAAGATGLVSHAGILGASFLGGAVVDASTKSGDNEITNKNILAHQEVTNQVSQEEETKTKTAEAKKDEATKGNDSKSTDDRSKDSKSKNNDQSKTDVRPVTQNDIQPGKDGLLTLNDKVARDITYNQVATQNRDEYFKESLDEIKNNIDELKEYIKKRNEHLNKEKNKKKEDLNKDFINNIIKDIWWNESRLKLYEEILKIKEKGGKKEDVSVELKSATDNTVAEATTPDIDTDIAISEAEKLKLQSAVVANMITKDQYEKALSENNHELVKTVEEKLSKGITSLTAPQLASLVTESSKVGSLQAGSAVNSTTNKPYVDSSMTV